MERSTFHVVSVVNGSALAQGAYVPHRPVAPEPVILEPGPDAGTLFWPHWLADNTTSAVLIAGVLGLLVDANWATTAGGHPHARRCRSRPVSDPHFLTR